MAVAKVDNVQVTDDVMTTLINDVLQSNNRQPSVPSVVLETIQDVIEAEPITFEEEGIDQNDTDDETQEVKLELGDDDDDDKQPIRELDTNKEPIRDIDSKSANQKEALVANGHVTTSAPSSDSRTSKSNDEAGSPKGIYEKSVLTEKKSDAQKKIENVQMRKKETETPSTFSRQVCYTFYLDHRSVSVDHIAFCVF